MAQTADIDGSGNNTVQIIGDGNSVTLQRAAALRISRYPEGSSRAQIRREFDLLKPYARALDMVGREDERRSLRDWLTSEEKLSVRVMTGQGGSGKTRLALDLCDHLPSEDWQAGFVDGDDLKIFCNDATSVDWAWSRPTLVIVDYAATFGDTLHRWLGRLADHVPDDAPPLRILLLERQADRQSGWWRTVFGGGKARDEAISDLLEPDRPVDIQPLATAALRREIFLAALSRTAKELGKDAPAVDHSESFDKRLADLTWGGRPLFLMMAAMLAARDGVPDVLALSRIDLAMRLARRELRRIGAAAREQGLDDVVVETLAAYVTLCQGLERDALIEAVGIVQKHLHRSGDAGPIADLLRDQNPGPDGTVAAILPDIIGEATMLLAFERDDIGPDLALNGFQQTGNRAAASIIRTAQDFAGQSVGDETITAPLAWLDRLIEREDVAFDQLSVVSFELIQILQKYSASLALTDHARRVIEKILDHLLSLPEPDDNVIAEIARSKINLSAMLSALGRREDALEAAVEAVSLRRHLASERPGKFTPSLAMSLNNLSAMLSALGRRESALEVVEETVDLYRRLACERPDAFTHNLAMSLNNLSTMLRAFERRKDALNAAEDAVNLTRRLASELPDAFLPDLAMSLNNLANELSALGRREDATRAAEESVSLYRPLACERPAAFLPYLATSLHTLANRLLEIGRKVDALSVISEAIRLRQELARAHPDAFDSWLSNSLWVKARCLSALKNEGKALVSNRSAISMLKRSFLQHPPSFIHWMKPMCQQYIERCEALGERPDEELLWPIIEAIQKMEEK